MVNQNQVFKYNGNSITFQIGENTMVNATEMAKPFDNSKRPQFWLNNQYTKDFINELAEARNLASADLVVITKGGNNHTQQGTWFHEDVALEFARWLSPKFAIWCNDRIKDILKRQYTSPSQPALSTDQGMILVQALDKATELMKNYVPKMWQPHCENAIAPVDFSKIVKRCTKERPDVYIDNSIVARYMAGEGFVKFSDGYYFPTQKGIDYGVFTINDIDFFQPDGQSMKFGLPVLPETGVAFIAPKLVEMKIREDFIKYPPIVS